MDWQQIVGMAVIAVLGAIAAGVTRYLNSRDNKVLTDKVLALTTRVNDVELAERRCQQERADQAVKLAESLAREQVLREVLPAEMVKNVELLVTETRNQTKAMEALHTAIGSRAEAISTISDLVLDTRKQHSEVKSTTDLLGKVIARLEVLEKKNHPHPKEPRS